MTTPLATPGPLTPHNRTVGARGERLAAEYLESLGYQILSRNWRDGRRGELDLVARDGEYFVAVEVKTRTGIGYGHPLEAITAQKAGRLRRLLHSWVRERAVGTPRLRVDAVGITLNRTERPRIDHLRGIG